MPRWFIPFVAALGLCGCLVGPNYHRPQTVLPTEFPGAPAAKESIADKKWFDLFQDTVLRSLVATAIQDNRDVRTAIATIVR